MKSPFRRRRKQKKKVKNIRVIYLSKFSKSRVIYYIHVLLVWQKIRKATLDYNIKLGKEVKNRPE